MAIDVQPAGRNSVNRSATNALPRNAPSHPANGTPSQGTGGVIPPIQVDVHQQPVETLGSRRTVLRKRGDGSDRRGDEGTDTEKPLIVETHDPQQKSMIAQFALQVISALQGAADTFKDCGAKIVDMFGKLLDITGVPR